MIKCRSGGSKKELLGRKKCRLTSMSVQRSRCRDRRRLPEGFGDHQRQWLNHRWRPPPNAGVAHDCWCHPYRCYRASASGSAGRFPAAWSRATSARDRRSLYLRVSTPTARSGITTLSSALYSRQLGSCPKRTLWNRERLLTGKEVAHVLRALTCRGLVLAGAYYLQRSKSSCVRNLRACCRRLAVPSSLPRARRGRSNWLREGESKRQSSCIVPRWPAWNASCAILSQGRSHWGIQQTRFSDEALRLAG